MKYHSDDLHTWMVATANGALADNWRHSWESLYWLLAEEYPDATDAQIEVAISQSAYG